MINYCKQIIPIVRKNHDTGYKSIQIMKKLTITFVLLADFNPEPWLKGLSRGSSAGSLSGCSRYSLVLNESLISSKQCINSYVCELEKMTWEGKGEQVNKRKQDATLQNSTELSTILLEEFDLDRSINQLINQSISYSINQIRFKATPKAIEASPNVLEATFARPLKFSFFFN